ncbi:MAG: hypothetical protein P8P29_03270 [Flavobacteriaceae bacterium]|nr:hypothetical protein [Flavobacteriaceae bacterium]
MKIETNDALMCILDTLRGSTSSDLYELSLLAESSGNENMVQDIKAAASAIEFVIDFLEESERLRTAPSEATMLRIMLDECTRAHKGRAFTKSNEPQVILDQTTGGRIPISHFRTWLKELQAKETSDI